MSMIIERHPCGCEHLVEYCYKCLGLLSPTTEEVLARRIEHLVVEGMHEQAKDAIRRREKLRYDYTRSNFRSGKPKEEVGRG